MKNGFGRLLFLTLTGAAATLLGGEARAGYLAQVSATVGSPSSGAGTVAGSTLTFSATYLTSSANSPTSPFGGVADPNATQTNYSWTLAFPSTGATNFALTTSVNGVAGTTTNLVTPTSPVTGYYVAGSVVYLQFAGYLGTAAPSGSSSYTTYVEVNTFTHSVNVGLLPPNVLGDPGTSGGLNPTPVPEPSTFALLGLGGVMLVVPRLRRFRRKASVEAKVGAETGESA